MLRRSGAGIGGLSLAFLMQEAMQQEGWAGDSDFRAWRAVACGHVGSKTSVEKVCWAGITESSW
jgi:hypothetical protein